jgi:IS4 transposase
MEQATDLVDIHLVMADKAFDQHGVFHVLDRTHDVNYLIPKRTNSDHLRSQAEEVCTDTTVTARVEQAASLYLHDDTPYIDTDNDPTVGEEGYSHDVTFMHVPAERDDWIVRHQDDTGYALFATNREDVSPLDAEGLVNRYSERWSIEIAYRSILPLLPSIASTDYRMRFFSFVFSCLLYNMWRVVDHSLKELASEAIEDYGRTSTEERLDPVLPLADFLTSSVVVIFNGGLDPPDFA